MDYATSVFPVTHVDPQLDVPLEPHSFYNHEDESIFRLCIAFLLTFIQPNVMIYFADQTDLFSGCPVGLQLIGKTLEEEAVLRMTYIVDEALKKAAI